MTDSVVLVVGFSARDDSVGELRERLLGIVDRTRAVEGCLRYDLHTHAGDPLRLTFVEEWATSEAHAAHDLTPWVLDLREHLPALLAEDVQVTRLARLEPATAQP